MIYPIPIAIGAGLCSALLYLASAAGAFPGGMLAILSPLPIMIAALGWRHRWGLAAIGVAFIALILIAVPGSETNSFTPAIVYLVDVGLPAWILAYLALLARQQSATVEWFSIGSLLCICGVLSGLIIPALLSNFGNIGYEEYRNGLRAELRSLLAQLQSSPYPLPTLPADVTWETFIEAVARITPLIGGFLSTVFFALNLYLAGKSVFASGRLPRPWTAPYLAPAPKISAPLLMAVGICAAFLDGFPGIFGMALTGGMVAVFCLHGLAVIHAITRSNPIRPILLLALYGSVLFLPTITPALLTLCGIADTLFNLRRRIGPGGGNPPLSTF